MGHRRDLGEIFRLDPCVASPHLHTDEHGPCWEGDRVSHRGKSHFLWNDYRIFTDFFLKPRNHVVHGKSMLILFC